MDAPSCSCVVLLIRISSPCQLLALAIGQIALILAGAAVDKLVILAGGLCYSSICLASSALLCNPRRRSHSCRALTAAAAAGACTVHRDPRRGGSHVSRLSAQYVQTLGGLHSAAWQSLMNTSHLQPHLHHGWKQRLAQSYGPLACLPEAPPGLCPCWQALAAAAGEQRPECLELQHAWQCIMRGRCQANGPHPSMH